MSVSSRSVSIISVKKAFDSGERPGPAERGPLSDKTQFVGQRYTLLLSGDNKNPRRKFFCENFEKTPKRLPGQSFPCAILRPSGAEKKSGERTGADRGGHRNRGLSVGRILHHER